MRKVNIRATCVSEGTGKTLEEEERPFKRCILYNVRASFSVCSFHTLHINKLFLLLLQRKEIPVGDVYRTDR